MLAAVAATLVLGISVGATAAGFRKNIEVDYSGVKIKVDGQVVDTANSQPFIVVEEGRTYVPARYLAEALGAKVGFDSETNSVLVYTPKYMESKTEEGVTTYTFPYYGASVQWPAAGQLRPSNAYLLQHESSNAIFQVNRIAFNPTAMPFDPMVTAMVSGLKSTLPITITGEEKITVTGAVGAKELTGIAKLAGMDMPMRLRFVADQNNIWLMMAITIPTGAMDDATVTKYLNTFTLGK